METSQEAGSRRTQNTEKDAGGLTVPEAAGLSAARLREATDLLRRYVAEQKIAGTVAAVANAGPRC